MKFKLLVYLLALLTVNGLEASGLNSSPNVVNFSVRDYHAGNKNWDITSDSRGFLYVANNDGLLTFDGTRWTLFTDAKCGLIRSVAAGPGDIIYSGGYEEFGYWERDQKGNFNYHVLSGLLPEGTLQNEDIWKIRVRNDGVFFQSFTRIYHYNNGEITVADPDKFMVFLHPVRDSLFIHSDGALLRLENDTLLPHARTGLGLVRVILPYGEDSMLLGTDTEGLYILESDGKLSGWNSGIAKVINGSDLNNAIRLNKGGYVFGTILDGLYITDEKGNILSHFNTSNYLRNNTILSLHQDRDGNIWVGMDNGIARLDYSTDFHFFLDHAGKLGSVYDAALFNNYLYVGTNRGIFRIPWDAFGRTDPVSHAELIEGTQGQVWSLKVFDGQLLCGHNRGLLRIKDKHVEYLYHNNGIFDFTFERGIQGAHLFASSYSLPQVFSEDPSGFRYSNALENFSAPCRYIGIDHLGNLWLAHMNDRLYKCRTDSHYTRITRTEVYTPLDFGDDRNNPIKIGSVGGRMIFISADRFFLYDDISGRMVPYAGLNEKKLKVSNINRIVRQGNDRYWLAGKNSVALFRQVEDSVTILKEYDLEAFGISTVDGFENVAVLNDSLTLVCLDEGFLIHNNNVLNSPSGIERAPILLQVVTTDRAGQADTLSINRLYGNKIPYRKNSISFDLSYPDISGRNVLMQYKLEGLNSRWHDMPAGKELNFDRLPKGDYKLSVYAVNEKGDRSPESVYSFTVMGPWYLSIYAILLYLIAAAGIFILLMTGERRRLRMRHIRRMQKLEKEYLLKQNEQLKDEVRERGKELFDVTNTMINKNKVLTKIQNEFENYRETAGNKFPVSLYDKVNALIEKDISSDDDWKLFVMHFEQNHKDFFKNVKERYPSLTSGDLKLCACLKLNLSTKDIASLLCISVRGVEISRYRLRKKIELDSSVGLNEWFIENF